jgi:predicted O-methyltransferase YrrM
VEYPSHLDEAVRLLRPGGLVVLDDVLRAGHLDDGTAVDSATLAVRELARQVREDERLVPVLLPVSGGLLCALKK